MTLATSTIATSVGRVAIAFARLAIAAAGDATAVFRTVYGLSDGKDYGRYFTGQNPLLGFLDEAGSLEGMINEGVAARDAVMNAGSLLITAGNTGIAGFGAACDAMTEAVRSACSDPADAVRILGWLAGFAMFRPGGIIGTFWDCEVSGPDDPLAEWSPGQVAITDGRGEEIYVLTAIAVLRLRIAAVASLARATTDFLPSSQQDAARLRDGVCALIDTLAEKCADLFWDRTASSLDRMRARVYADLTERGAKLAPVVRKIFAVPLPADVIAARLYDDPTRAQDLIARNGEVTPHPLFMPRVIEALVN